MSERAPRDYYGCALPIAIVSSIGILVGIGAYISAARLNEQLQQEHLAALAMKDQLPPYDLPPPATFEVE